MKKLKIILCIALALIVIGASVAYVFLPHSLSYDIDSIQFVGSDVEVVSKDADTVNIKKANDSDFKILMFTDMHLDGKNKTSNITVDYLVRNVQKEKPDLVILAGDNVTSAFNKKRSNQLARIFEKAGVYWAGILGNHEGDNKFSISREEMVEIFSSYDHCLMLAGPDDIWGCCNYNLNILNSDGTLKKSFYFLDTGDEINAAVAEQYAIPDNGKTHYDGAKENQVEWYCEKVKENIKKYGMNESVMVVHIPLYEVKEAAENAEFLYGEKLEGVCSTCFDSGLFGKIKELGSTKYVFFGHDHLNTFGINLDGVVLSYLQPSGYGSYTAASRFGYEEKDWLQGYTAFNIKADGTMSYSQFRNSENK